MSDAVGNAPDAEALRPELNILQQARQNWAEVYLILDFISGKEGKNLSDLREFKFKGQLPSDNGQQAQPPAAALPDNLQDPELLHISILNKFYDIGKKIDCKNCADSDDLQFLLRLKDKLNGLADPAKGLSIAYTSMIVNDHLGGGQKFGRVTRPSILGIWWETLRRHLGGPSSTAGKYVERDEEKWLLSNGRGRYAKIAYPDLVKNSYVFYRGIIYVLPLLIMALVAFSAATSWDVYYVKDRAQQLSDLKSLTFSDGSTVTEAKCTERATNKNNADDGKICEKFEINKSKSIIIQKELFDYSTERFTSKKDGFPEYFYYIWKFQDTFDMFKWYLRAVMPQLQIGDKENIEVVLAPYADLFINGVLPMFFGLLGTLAGVMRTTIGRMSNWLLSPRDMPRAVYNLPLGILAGFVVGQYLSPANLKMTGVSLTAAGLSFIAGYGADYFFQFLDMLLKRVFAVDQK